MASDVRLRRGTGLVGRPEGMPVSAHLRVLDGFRLTADDEPIPLSLCAQRLLALLAIHDRPLHRSFVAGVLWPDATEKHAAASLRSALWRLSQPHDGRATVMATPQTVALASAVRLDLREALAAGKALLQGAAGTPDVSMFSGDVLTDWYEDWVIVARERFRQLRLHALEVLCLRLSGEGRAAAAIEAGLAAVAGEPLRESAQRVLIEAHLAEGNAVEAVRQHDRFRNLLRAELGVEPSPLMEALMRRVRPLTVRM